MSDYTRKSIQVFAALCLGLGAILAFQAFTGKLADTYEHVRYEKDGKTIDKATYDREFHKDPGSVAECARNTRTGEILCAGG